MSSARALEPFFSDFLLLLLASFFPAASLLELGPLSFPAVLLGVFFTRVTFPSRSLCSSGSTPLAPFRTSRDSDLNVLLMAIWRFWYTLYAKKTTMAIEM